MSRSSRRWWGRAIAEILGPHPRKVLDVGTGTGLLAVEIARAGHRVVGLDVTPAMLQRVASRARAAKIDLQLVEGDATRLPFAPQAFDAVVSRHLLWTLSDPKRAFCEWIVATHVGGVIVWFDALWPDWVTFGRTASGKLYFALSRLKAAIRRAAQRPALRQRAACDYGESLTGKFPFRGLTSTTPVVDLLSCLGVGEVKLQNVPPLSLAGVIQKFGSPLRPQETYYYGRFTVTDEVHRAALLQLVSE